MRLVKQSVGYLVCVGLLQFAVGSALADTITGKLEFSFRPPSAGIIYVDTEEYTTKEIKIDQVGKQFSSIMAVSSPAAKIEFTNSDDFEHNVFANDFRSGVKFNIGLMRPGSKVIIDTSWKVGSIVRIGCKIHPKMRVYVANIETDIYQTLAFNTKTKIYDINLLNVPKDANIIRFEIPRYDPIIVKLSAGETITKELTKNSKPKGSLTLTRN